MKNLVLTSLFLMTSCQDSEKAELQAQIKMLQSENDALKSKVESLKEQTVALKTQVAVFHEGVSQAKASATKEAAKAYARACAMALVLAELEIGSGYPNEWNGKACDDTEVLGREALPLRFGISKSKINITNDGRDFYVDVTDTNGNVIKYDLP